MLLIEDGEENKEDIKERNEDEVKVCALDRAVSSLHKEYVGSRGWGI